jgi:hypothetical protein
MAANTIATDSGKGNPIMRKPSKDENNSLKTLDQKIEECIKDSGLKRTEPPRDWSKVIRSLQEKQNKA